MKTIAISIDEETLGALDRLVRRRAKAGPRGRTHGRASSRSLLVRLALAEFIAIRERDAREAEEREIFAKHRAKLRRQAKALVGEQAKP